MSVLRARGFPVTPVLRFRRLRKVQSSAFTLSTCLRIDRVEEACPPRPLLQTSSLELRNSDVMALLRSRRDALMSALAIVRQTLKLSSASFPASPAFQARSATNNRPVRQLFAQPISSLINPTSSPSHPHTQLGGFATVIISNGKSRRQFGSASEVSTRSSLESDVDAGIRLTDACVQVLPLSRYSSPRKPPLP